MNFGSTRECCVGYLDPEFDVVGTTHEYSLGLTSLMAIDHNITDLSVIDWFLWSVQLCTTIRPHSAHKPIIDVSVCKKCKPLGERKGHINNRCHEIFASGMGREQCLKYQGKVSKDLGPVAKDQT